MNANVFDRLGATWRVESSLLSQMADFNPLRLAYLKEVLCTLENKEILDLGCGGGLFSEVLAEEGALVTGIDLSSAAIDSAQRHAESRELAITYQTADASRLPFQEASFDTVVASEVLEHFEDVPAVLAEVARILQPGGKFIFDTPNRTWISRSLLIGLGEWVLRKIPCGTHEGQRFIRPEELSVSLQTKGMNTKNIRGFWVTGRDSDGRWKFRFTQNTWLAYFGWAERA